MLHAAMRMVRNAALLLAQQAVKCVVACGPFLASGGTDDTIHLYDLQACRPLEPSLFTFQLCTLRRMTRTSAS